MFYYILIVFIILLDQLTKYYAKKKLIVIKTYPVIKDKFHFTYVENTGAAYGILKDKQELLITITFAVIVFVCAMFYKAMLINEIWIYKLSLSMIIGGAIGNMSDRIRIHYVIDFFDIRKDKFAIFNIADVAIVIGTILLTYSTLFENIDI